MMSIKKIRIGTRGSKLALAQAYMVERLLLENHPYLQTEIITITTTGDKILEKNLNEIGGKGLFIKEIEEQLLDGSIDIAVHSMKDMPAEVYPDFEIACILEREDPRDAFVSPIYSSVARLPQGATVGTSSPRRAAQLLNMRPDIKIIPFRGNIHTRLQKLRDGVADATFLAMAGLIRSGITDNMIKPVEPDQMLPAVAQGAIGIEIRKGDSGIKQLISPLHHNETAIRIEAERAFLGEFEGSCKTPIGALANINGNSISIDFLVARTDGSEILRTSRTGSINQAKELGIDAAKELLEKTGSGFF